MPCREKLSEFITWCHKNITGDEMCHAQIFLDRLFQAFGQPGCLDVGGTTEFRIRKADEDADGTAFADYVWKPVVLVEMKKRGEKLEKHRSQAFNYWMRLVPNRLRYTSESVFDTFPWPQFDVSPSAARRDIVVEPPANNRLSSVGATSSEYAAPDGAKSKSTTAVPNSSSVVGDEVTSL